MIRKRCKECGKLMAFEKVADVRAFCSKGCYKEYRQKLFAKEDDGPAMPPLDADRITDEGFTALVAAIVQRASDDVKNFAPGTQVRKEAEAFFLSDHFGKLTGLDGEQILLSLQERDKFKRKRRQGKRDGCQIRCIETGVVYDSLTQAGDAFGVTPGAIAYACKGGKRTAVGLHFEYVEG